MGERAGSRVVAMSMKPRSAIPLAGHHADFVDLVRRSRRLGDVVGLHRTRRSVVRQEFIKANPVDRDADKIWERSLPADRYQVRGRCARRSASPPGWDDDVSASRCGDGGRRGVLHALDASPFADEYLERMAEAAIDTLTLGTAAATDFLAVSFSSLDSVGHAFGPRSHEVQDMLVRLDATIGKLLDHLDAMVGAGTTCWRCRADHGVADVPEQDPGGGRQRAGKSRTRIEKVLKPVLRRRRPDRRGASETDIYSPAGYVRASARIRTLAPRRLDALLALPGVARVFLERRRSTPRGARTSTDPPSARRRSATSPDAAAI